MLARLQKLLRLAPYAPTLLREVLRARRVLREVESARFREGPEALVTRLRACGAKVKPRSVGAKGRLEAVVRTLDARMNGGPNCYRRSLALIALDPDSARTPLVLGLDMDADGASGHAWVVGTETPRAYGVEFRL